MAKAVSRIITGNEQDVLQGTVLGVLPTDAPSYDVEVQVAALTDPSGPESFTLIVNGVAVMERSFMIGATKEIVVGSGNSAANPALQLSEPRGDSPSAFFNAAGGSRLTLNIQGVASDDTTMVYVKATENMGPALVSPVGHIGRVSGANLNQQDVLQGTPIGTVPATAQAWEISLAAARIAAASASSPTAITPRSDENITLLADSDTVVENFVLPIRVSSDFPVFERDELITALVTGGTRLTLNIFGGAGSVAIVYRVFAVPVA
ncbi:hypothetical protein F4Y93_10880 [Candidatus Poribacteria bacterium]|nr:hypothetical protein [Candidatus Poribacteria bacterium]